MKKSNSTILISLPIVIISFLYSCAEDQYDEMRSGPWKVTKVEQAFYTGDNNEPDSIRVYESDTLGYFNFYNSHPYGNVYMFINYPSFFVGNSIETEYEVHPNNPEILTFIYYSINTSNYLNFTVTGANRKRQVWTTINRFNDMIVRETIWVKKQSNIN